MCSLDRGHVELELGVSPLLVAGPFCVEDGSAPGRPFDLRFEQSDEPLGRHLLPFRRSENLQTRGGEFRQLHAIGAVLVCQEDADLQYDLVTLVEGAPLGLLDGHLDLARPQRGRRQGQGKARAHEHCDQPADPEDTRSHRLTRLSVEHAR